MSLSVFRALLAGFLGAGEESASDVRHDATLELDQLGVVFGVRFHHARRDR